MKEYHSNQLVIDQPHVEQPLNKQPVMPGIFPEKSPQSSDKKDFATNLIGWVLQGGVILTRWCYS